MAANTTIGGYRLGKDVAGFNNYFIVDALVDVLLKQTYKILNNGMAK